MTVIYLKPYTLSIVMPGISRGYIAGGAITGGDATSNAIDGFRFDSESLYQSNAQLAVGRTNLAAANSALKGYFAGGYNFTAEIDGLRFDSETSINPSAVLSFTRRDSAGCGSLTKGYFAGGYGILGASATYTTRIDTMDFSTETNVNTLTLTRGRTGLASCTSPGIKGYFAGGYYNTSTGTAAATYSTLDSVVFSTDSVVLQTATLPETRAFFAAVQSTTNGYFGGGGPYSPFSGYTLRNKIAKLNFSSETTTNLVQLISTNRATLCGSSSVSVGFFIGGDITSVIDGVQFTTDTVYVSSTVLPSNRNQLAGTQFNT